MYKLMALGVGMKCFFCRGEANVASLPLYLNLFGQIHSFAQRRKNGTCRGAQSKPRQKGQEQVQFRKCRFCWQLDALYDLGKLLRHHLYYKSNCAIARLSDVARLRSPIYTRNNKAGQNMDYVPDHELGVFDMQCTEGSRTPLHVVSFLKQGK